MHSKSRRSELEAAARQGDRYARSKLRMSAVQNQRQASRTALEQRAKAGNPSAQRQLAKALRAEGQHDMADYYQGKADRTHAHPTPEAFLKAKRAGANG